jgi:hypothetical protein
MSLGRGYDIMPHPMYPEEYYITKDGKMMEPWVDIGPNMRQPTRRLPYRTAVRLVSLLIQQYFEKIK